MSLSFKFPLVAMKVLNQTHLMRSHHFYDDIGTFRRTLTQSGSLHGQKCRNVSYT